MHAGLHTPCLSLMLFSILAASSLLMLDTAGGSLQQANVYITVPTELICYLRLTLFEMMLPTRSPKRVLVALQFSLPAISFRLWIGVNHKPHKNYCNKHISTPNITFPFRQDS